MSASPIHTSNPEAPISIGALAPISSPGWTEAGTQLLAELELGVEHLNTAGGVNGRAVQLLVRDTSASAMRAANAVDELAGLGVAAIVGEYHSVAASAAAIRADALRIPFICASAVLDHLTADWSDCVARVAPAQSYGWRIYADYLLDAGHRNLALAIDPSTYWIAGSRILHSAFEGAGGAMVKLDASALGADGVCDALAASGATAVLLLTGFPEPSISLLRAVRSDPRLRGITIGAPAGQPEFNGWDNALGSLGAAVPFLRYLPDQLTRMGLRVQSEFHRRSGQEALFMAYEGYDTTLVLASILRCRCDQPSSWEASWRQVCVEGTRGTIALSRTDHQSAWQWTWPPVQVVERNPVDPTSFTVLRSSPPQ